MSSRIESQRGNDLSAFFETSAVAVLGSLKENGGPDYGAIKLRKELILERGLTPE